MCVCDIVLLILKKILFCVDCGQKNDTYILIPLCNKIKSKEDEYFCNTLYLSLITFFCPLYPFQPELTVENLPLYLEVKKKLLLLFVGEEESGRKGNKRVLDDMRSLLNTGLLNPYLPCWIHLGHTPAGKAVLEAYLGFLPLLPALVVSQLATGGEVFHYPTGRPLMVQPILQWLQRVEDGEEPPAGMGGGGGGGVNVLGWSSVSLIYTLYTGSDQNDHC
ncbi:unnamed protein product [Oncorhynchus mykiss]|uniref:Uncharacterized protein n=1 Tax=Oncorhynchus mykiss TaxID=8022 RepID=A0A060VZM8_ONCMY|nr:unnamed protein product [Oncorhynchus mykiss]